ncbi:hypothetical protein K438DRAFT_1761943 [Mycena galopus ATCC 62051]|nr:hypothetical protein K438DRAFT_1761943 [Mycena galopus ATCC 62051]
MILRIELRITEEASIRSLRTQSESARTNNKLGEAFVAKQRALREIIKGLRPLPSRRLDGTRQTGAVPVPSEIFPTFQRDGYGTGQLLRWTRAAIFFCPHATGSGRSYVLSMAHSYIILLGYASVAGAYNSVHFARDISTIPDRPLRLNTFSREAVTPFHSGGRV